MSDPAPELRPALPADTPAGDVISRELATGEHLIWAGRPPAGLDLRAADWRNLFTVVGLAAFEVAVFTAAGGGPFAVFNGYAVGSALCLHFAHRFILEPQRRRYTWYGLTSERVLVVTVQRGVTQVSSVVLAHTGDVHLTERADGSGLIEFGNPLSARDAENRSVAWVMSRAAVVELPAGARAVFELVRDVQRAQAWLIGRGDR